MGNKQMKLHQWRTLEALPPLTHPVGKAFAIWLDVSRHNNLRKLHAAQCVLPTSDGPILHRLNNPIFELIYTSAPLQSSPWQCTVCPSCPAGTPWFLCWGLQHWCPTFSHLLHAVDAFIHFYHTLPQQFFSNLKSTPYTKTINTSEDVGCRDSSCPSSHPASSFLWREAQNCLQKSVWYNCSILQHRPLDIFFWFPSYSTQLSASRCAWVLNWGFRQLSWFDFADLRITNLDPVFMYAQHMRNTLHCSVLGGTEMPLGVLSLKHFLLQDHCHIFTASVCMWNTWSRHQ